MKQWKLIRSFYSGMRLPCLLLLLLMAVSLTVLTVGVGNYRYVTYAQTVMQHSGLDNAVCVSYFGQECPDDLTEEYRYMKEQPCVDDVMYGVSAGPIVCRDEGITLHLMPESVYAKLPFFLPKGELFSDSGLTADGKLQCVVGAPFLEDVKTGDTIDLYNGATGEKMEVYVTGKLPYPYFQPGFGSAGDVTADAFIEAVQILLAKDTPQTRAVLKEMDMTYISSLSYWVVFKDTATSTEKADFIHFLRQDHHVSTYEDIMENTDAAAAETAAGALAAPLYFLFITTVSFVSMAVLLLYKKINQQAIWFLCGCSKGRGYRYASTAIGLICLVSCLVPLLLIWQYPVWGEMDLMPIHMYFDWWSVWILLGYLAAVLALSFAIPFALQYKASPMQVLRRLDE